MREATTSTTNPDRVVLVAKVNYQDVKLRLHNARIALIDAQAALQSDHEAGHTDQDSQETLQQAIIDAEDVITRLSAEKMIASRAVGRAIDKQRSANVGNSSIMDAVRSLIGQKFGDGILVDVVGLGDSIFGSEGKGGLTDRLTGYGSSLFGGQGLIDDVPGFPRSHGDHHHQSFDTRDIRTASARPMRG